MIDKRYRLGVLTPSSNTSLEPLTANLVANIPGTSAHFSRFKVTKIALDKKAEDQFLLEKMLSASDLLVDCQSDVIGWSGTSSSWLGFDKDEALCKTIQERTGIPATTSILALNEILQKISQSRFALVTPYSSEVQQQIIENYHANGYEVMAEDHLKITDNFSFANISDEVLSAQVRKMAKQGAPLIVVACTNLKSADLVSQWEDEFGIPILDTTTTVIWKMLQIIGQKPTISGWGKLMSGELLNEY